MDSLLGSLDPQIVLGVAAVAVSLLLVILLIRILKATGGLILAIVAIVLVLQYFFGISPDQLTGAIADLPQAVSQLLKGIDLSALASMFSN